MQMSNSSNYTCRCGERDQRHMAVSSLSAAMPDTIFSCTVSRTHRREGSQLTLLRLQAGPEETGLEILTPRVNRTARASAAGWELRQSPAERRKCWEMVRPPAVERRGSAAGSGPVAAASPVAGTAALERAALASAVAGAAAAAAAVAATAAGRSAAAAAATAAGSLAVAVAASPAQARAATHVPAVAPSSWDTRTPRL